MAGTIVTAHAALKARGAAQITLLSTILWQDEDNQLPDEPAPFVFFELITDRAEFIEIGGGRGSNRARQDGELHGFVFVPRGWGLEAMLPLAEHVAAAFRSYRLAGAVSCGAASVHPVGEGADLVPPGLSSAAGNYSCNLVSVPFFFEQVG